MANQLNGLKTINNLQRDGSLQNLLLSIKDSKLEVDAFSKKLQEKKQNLQAKLREEEKLKEQKVEQVKAEEKKVEPASPNKQVEEKRENKEFKQDSNKFRKFDNSNNQNKKNFQPGKKPPFNKNTPQNGAKKPFVSTKANNFKSFAPTESSSVLAQPERNFGNKNKRRNVEETKKQQRQKNKRAL